MTVAKIVGLILLGTMTGYGIGVWQWRGMAVIKSYVIGYDDGYNTGLSDASIPGAEVIEVSPDGKIMSRKKNPNK